MHFITFSSLNTKSNMSLSPESCCPVEPVALWNLFFCENCCSVDSVALWNLLPCKTCFTVEHVLLWKMLPCFPVEPVAEFFF